MQLSTNSSSVPANGEKLQSFNRNSDATDNWHLNLALSYAANAKPVFPCNPSTKKPLVSGGFKSATCDLKIVTAWWREHPIAMVGMPTGPSSDLFVVDLDVRSGIDGIAEFERIIGIETEQLTNHIARTPSGGLHLYFRLGVGHHPRTRSADIGPGIDVRGCNASGDDGGYVILPGNINANGDCYEWV